MRKRLRRRNDCQIRQLLERAQRAMLDFMKRTRVMCLYAAAIQYACNESLNRRTDGLHQHDRQPTLGYSLPGAAEEGDLIFNTQGCAKTGRKNRADRESDQEAEAQGE